MFFDCTIPLINKIRETNFVRSVLLSSLVIVIGAGLIGSAYAHKSQVVDNYRFEVGWDKEPPIAGKPNNVVIGVYNTDSTDKPASKTGNVKHQQHKDSDSKTKQGIKKLTKSNKKIQTKSPTLGISGLEDVLEVDVTLNGKKTFLKLVEDKSRRGTYLGAYTPEKDGYPIVHLYGKLDNKDIEITFHPEKVNAQ